MKTLTMKTVTRYTFRNENKKLNVVVYAIDRELAWQRLATEMADEINPYNRPLALADWRLIEYELH